MQLIQTLSAARAPNWSVRMLSCALIATALTLPQPAIASEMPELPAQHECRMGIECSKRLSLDRTGRKECGQIHTGSVSCQE